MGFTLPGIWGAVCRFLPAYKYFSQAYKYSSCQRRSEGLVEVCDPSEAVEFGYTVNGITMSDFYTPSYFDPVFAPGVRYSFTGAIREPRQVLAGGYLSWHEPITDHWWQLIFFTDRPQFRDLGRLELDLSFHLDGVAAGDHREEVVQEP